MAGFLVWGFSELYVEAERIYDVQARQSKAVALSAPHTFHGPVHARINSKGRINLSGR